MFLFCSKCSLRSLLVTFSVCMLSMSFCNGITEEVDNFPLHKAALDGNLEGVKHLIENESNKANINEKDNMGRTALHIATSWGNKGIVTYLIEKGANINEKNNMGRTALHIAVDEDNLEIVKYLIEKGANINEKNNMGQTALHIAASAHDLTKTEEIKKIHDLAKTEEIKKILEDALETKKLQQSLALLKAKFLSLAKALTK